MKAYEFVLAKKFLEHELEDKCFYFRVDYKFMIDFKKSMKEIEFMQSLQSKFNEFHSDFNHILTKLSDNEITFEYEDESSIWQDNFGNLIFSNKGIINNAENGSKLLETVAKIKSELLKEGIYLKLQNFL